MQSPDHVHKIKNKAAKNDSIEHTPKLTYSNDIITYFMQTLFACTRHVVCIKYTHVHQHVLLECKWRHAMVETSAVLAHTRCKGTKHTLFKHSLFTIYVKSDHYFTVL